MGRVLYSVFTFVIVALWVGVASASRSTPPFGHDLFTVLPGRCNCASLNDVLDMITRTPGGRDFIQKFADDLSNRFGINIPPAVLDLVLNNATLLLDYLVMTPFDMQLAWMAMNLARDENDLKPVEPSLPPVPNGFDLADMASFPINVSALMPPLDPTELVPGLLWQAFSRGNESLVQDEVVMSLVWNQLAANSHLSPSNTSRFAVAYNGASYSSISDLLTAFAANGHTVDMYLTWRAVDFFGYLTRNATTGEFMSVPTPLFTATGVYDASGEEAIVPAIHNEYVIQIRSTASSHGTVFNGNLLWYEGDDGIGFFAQDIYAVGNWVGTETSEYVSGAEAIKYVQEMGVISDALIETARANDLYDWGYGITGVCVDSTGILEGMHFGGPSLYPMVMQRAYLLQELPILRARNPDLGPVYDEIEQAVQELEPDIYDNNPTSCQRALNSLAWSPGHETFQAAVDARRILSSVCQ